MLSPDKGLVAVPFGLLSDAGPSFTCGSLDGAQAQLIFSPVAAAAESARDPLPARSWLPSPAKAGAHTSQPRS